MILLTSNADVFFQFFVLHCPFNEKLFLRKNQAGIRLTNSRIGNGLRITRLKFLIPKFHIPINIRGSASGRKWARRFVFKVLKIT